MGSTLASAKLWPLFTAISHLIRHTYTASMDTEKVYKTHVTNGDSNKVKKFKLTDESCKMIELFLVKPLFDEKYTDNIEYAKALAHLCYGNQEITLKVVTNLMFVISHADKDSIKRVLRVFGEVVKVDDDISTQRFEMLLGFPFLMQSEDGELP